MKHLSIILGFLFIIATTNCTQNEGSQGKDFTEKVDNNAHQGTDDNE